MKFIPLFTHRLASWRAILLLAALSALSLPTSTARAGVTINLEIDRGNSASPPFYLCFPSLTTNSLTAVPPDTGYFVWSSNSTIDSGLNAQLFPDGSNPYGGNGYGDDYAALQQDLTNLWTLMVTNLTATNIYHFKFSSFTSNSLPLVTVLFPADGATNVTNQPTYSWRGPASYDSLYVQVANDDDSFARGAYLSASQTNWVTDNLIYAEHFGFFAQYSRDASANVVSSTPTNNAGVAFPGWKSTCGFATFGSAGFDVTDPYAGETSRSVLR